MSIINENNKYKTVAIDLDGTLLTDQHTISDFDKRMLVELQKSGVNVVFCSGMIYLLLSFVIHFKKYLFFYLFLFL